MEKEKTTQRNEWEPQVYFSDKSENYKPEFDRIIDSFFGNPMNPYLMSQMAPYSRKNLTDVRELDEAFVLTTEIPGIPKEEIHISVSGKVLSIHADYHVQGDSKTRLGQRHQSYRQSFTLPLNVDSEQITAQSELGILEVWIPKTKAAAVKKIEVQNRKSNSLSNNLSKQSDLMT